MFRAVVDVGVDDAEDLKCFATFIDIMWFNLTFI
jgi:hypothetical protein